MLKETIGKKKLNKLDMNFEPEKITVLSRNAGDTTKGNLEEY